MFYVITFSRRKNDHIFAELEDPEDKKTPSRIWYSNQQIEELKIKSKDKLILKGYFQDNHSNKLLVCLHGYRGRYYSNTTQSQIFFEHGYDVLLPNNRAHDTSEGKFFSMGPKEIDDVIRWIDLMIKRNPNYEIVLMGISMGAHIAMMLGGEKLPSNIKCIIEDCGYSNLKDQLNYELVKIKAPCKGFILFAANLYCRLFHGFSLKHNTATAFSNLTLPILLIHGDKDTYVKFENLKLNADSVPNNIYKEVVTFEGADHNRSKDQLEKYTETIINFVNKFIK
ncbi:MAG: alpha/beta hydrolase [Bacilli bacterium]|nr:alpha/beta hydrolase [Bacilli bacterium]